MKLITVITLSLLFYSSVSTLIQPFETREWVYNGEQHQSDSYVDANSYVHERNRWLDAQGYKHETDRWKDAQGNIHLIEKWEDIDGCVHEIHQVTSVSGQVEVAHYMKNDKGKIVGIEESHGSQSGDHACSLFEIVETEQSIPDFIR